MISPEKQMELATLARKWIAISDEAFDASLTAETTDKTQFAIGQYQAFLSCASALSAVLGVGVVEAAADVPK